MILVACDIAWFTSNLCNSPQHHVSVTPSTQFCTENVQHLAKESCIILHIFGGVALYLHCVDALEMNPSVLGLLEKFDTLIHHH